MKIKFLLLLLVHCFPYSMQVVSAQSLKKYNINIGKANNVNITKQVQNEVNYNYQDNAILYLLEAKGINDSTIGGKILMVFGNPDSLPIKDLNLRINSTLPLKNAYVEIQGSSTGPNMIIDGLNVTFNKNVALRNKKFALTEDKKTVILTGDLLAPGASILVYLIPSHENGSTISFQGANSLF